MKELEEIFKNLNLSEYYELQRQAVAFDDHNIEEEMTAGEVIKGDKAV